VLKFLKRTHSPYVGTGKAVSNTKYKKSGDGEVKLFDLDGDEMATFRDLFTAKALLPKYAQSFSARVKTTDSGIKIVYLKK